MNLTLKLCAIFTEFLLASMILSTVSSLTQILVQHLWGNTREWDDPNLPHDLLEAWLSWEKELPNLSTITLPHTSVSGILLSHPCLHIICDTSEQSYGAVSYIHTEDGQQQVNVSFLMERSNVAPQNSYQFHDLSYVLLSLELSFSVSSR